jgi:hypothetical protein
MKPKPTTIWPLGLCWGAAGAIAASACGSDSGSSPNTSGAGAGAGGGGAAGTLRVDIVEDAAACESTQYGDIF